MTEINKSTFQSFCLLSQEVQSVKKNLDQEEMNFSKRKELHLQLEKIQDSLEPLIQKTKQTQSQMTPLFSQLELLNREVISLYREIEERLEARQVELISKGTLELSQCLNQGKMGKMEGLASKIDSLRHQIDFLFTHRKPSLQHRKIVLLSLKILEQIDPSLQTQEEKSLQKIYTLKILLEEALTQVQLSYDDTAFSLELYEIIDLIYNKKQTEALFKLHTLRLHFTKAQQARLDLCHSPDQLTKALLEIADGDPCLEWEEPYLKVFHI